MSDSRVNTTPAEFLAWVGPWALDKAAKIIERTGEFGRPLLLGLSEDGTHHVSMLAFWSYDDHKTSMDLLRKVIRSHKMVAIALLSKGRVNRGEQIPVNAMILLKSERDMATTMEIYLPESTERVSFPEIPSESIQEVSGLLTDFWSREALIKTTDEASTGPS